METVSLLGALQAKLASLSLSPAVPVHGVILPAKTAYPAMCLRYEKTQFTYTFDPNIWEKGLFKLLSYATSGEVCETLLRQAAAQLLDKPLPTLVSGVTLQVYVEDLYLRETAVRGPSGEEMIEGVLELIVDVRRSGLPANIEG